MPDTKARRLRFRCEYEGDWIAEPDGYGSSLRFRVRKRDGKWIATRHTGDLFSLGFTGIGEGGGFGLGDDPHPFATKREAVEAAQIHYRLYG